MGKPSALPQLRSLLHQALLLNQYAVTPRYPGTAFQFTQDLVNEALAAAKEFREAVTTLIQP